MVQDSIEALRPDLEMFQAHQEAMEAALELERKYRDKIGMCVHQSVIATITANVTS